MASIMNLTPHAISFCDGDNNVVLTVEPSGQLARVSVKTVVTGEVINEIPVTTTE